MSQLRTSDPAVPELVRRYLYLLKPQEHPFTKVFPDELEENQYFLSVVVVMLKRYGLGYAKGIPEVLQDAYHFALAADFISVVKLERPDALYFLAKTAGVIKDE